jgi:signal transduction histidine kinase
MDEARAGDMEYGEFVTSLLAHDISNYNQTSRGYLEMLLEEQMGPLTEEQARVLTVCLRQANRIQSLLESIRLLSDLTRTPIELDTFNLDDAIRDAVQWVEKDFADREIRARFTPAGRLVKAERQLADVFRHLLSNAVRHNDAEVIEIEVRITEREAAAERRWEVLVTDNGAGVPPARVPDIFSRLGHRDIHGSGLGLSVVRELVERWGGKVWLEPGRPGVGAIFGLQLVAARSDG